MDQPGVPGHGRSGSIPSAIASLTEPCSLGLPARATLAAAHSAEQCGLSSSEVVHAGAALDRMSFRVSLRRPAPVLILRLLGSTGTSVTATATATAHPPAEPHDALGVPMTLTALRLRAVPSAASGRTALF
jgi:hypothetical protein